MAELQQLRVQEAVDSMVKSLEKENIRKMQGLMFRCSASCCEDSQASMQQVHQCIERCHAPLAQAQALVTSELEKFQSSPGGLSLFTGPELLLPLISMGPNPGVISESSSYSVYIIDTVDPLPS
ncbi:protein FAM136A isoform X2 [Aotus nancymaae]|uniref:protein FAM136A isoform X2 n=1 Tax=Aotus nancymaae TaxID=37293 RepID=UPI0030FE2E60